MQKSASILAAAVVTALSAAPALAHPHVFVDATVAITGDGRGHLASITNSWWMDEIFSSSVIPDFDKNANGKLDEDELAAVGEQVRKSIAEWEFYTFVRKDGTPVAMNPPSVLNVAWSDKTGKLQFRFTMTPKAPVDLKAAQLSVFDFDKSYFVAFNFAGPQSFVLRDMPKGCKKSLEMPTKDQAATAWMNYLSTLSVDDTAPVPEDGVNFSEVLSTKAQIDCR
ncbi:DUF1007 family protein [Aurantimonas sp. MSK8Z-1]|uniref:DUF1007 family protein n=1 Tax=Mangrovibrevibacter kandeliae TaxID=2968473 RepID=UPI0021188907|nr:DUF1007 family protein [Aurantimonas sp. MSK8Z-1]MCW4116133.1 DUF1007 family protein [Aurantimonas sp. MSK8Z-1]